MCREEIRHVQRDDWRAGADLNWHEKWLRCGEWTSRPQVLRDCCQSLEAGRSSQKHCLPAMLLREARLLPHSNSFRLLLITPLWTFPTAAPGRKPTCELSTWRSCILADIQHPRKSGVGTKVRSYEALCDEQSSRVRVQGLCSCKVRVGDGVTLQRV